MRPRSSIVRYLQCTNLCKYMPDLLAGLRLGFLITLVLPAVAQAPAVQRLPNAS